MTKAKYLIIAIFAILLLIPNVVNATDVSVTRNIYSNNGSYINRSKKDKIFI